MFAPSSCCEGGLARRTYQGDARAAFVPRGPASTRLARVPQPGQGTGQDGLSWPGANKRPGHPTSACHLEQPREGPPTLWAP